MTIAALAAAPSDQFLTGIVIGVLVGLLLGPILRSWLAWREWAEASREAEIADRLLEQIAQDSAQGDGGLIEDSHSRARKAVEWPDRERGAP